MNKIFFKFFGLRIYTCIQIPRHYPWLFSCTPRLLRNLHYTHPSIAVFVFMTSDSTPYALSTSRNKLRSFVKKTMNCVDSLGNQNRHGAFWEASHVNASIRHQHENPLTFAVKTLPDCTSSGGSLPNYLVVSTICVHQVNIKPPLIFTSQRNSVFFFISYY